MSADNRNFLTVILGGQSYETLLDPGATLSLIGPRVAERFKERLLPADSLMRTATGRVSPTTGVLKIMLEVEGVSKPIFFKGAAELDHDIILGMNFCKIFDMDLRLGRGQWRVHEGEWHSFMYDNKEEKLVVLAECTSISELIPSERERVDDLVDREGQWEFPPHRKRKIEGRTTRKELERPRYSKKMSGTRFNNIRLILTDPNIDPPPGKCFNCWQSGHRWMACPKAKVREFCTNCGRSGRKIVNCPRCSEPYQRHIKEKANEERRADRRGRSATRASDRPGEREKSRSRSVFDRLSRPGGKDEERGYVQRSEEGRERHQVKSDGGSRVKSEVFRGRSEKPYQRPYTLNLSPERQISRRQERSDTGRTAPRHPSTTDQSHNPDRQESLERSRLGAQITEREVSEAVRVAQALRLMSSLQGYSQDTQEAVLRAVYGDRKRGN